MEFEFSGRIFEKFSNPTFHENSSGGIRDVLCERTDGRADGQTETTKLFTILRTRLKIETRFETLRTASGLRSIFAVKKSHSNGGTLLCNFHAVGDI
jgi:hypothetical protein